MTFRGAASGSASLVLEAIDAGSDAAYGGVVADCGVTFEVRGGAIAYAATAAVSTTASGGGAVYASAELLVRDSADTRLLLVEDGSLAQEGVLEPGEYVARFGVVANTSALAAGEAEDAAGTVEFDLLLGGVPGTSTTSSTSSTSSSTSSSSTSSTTTTTSDTSSSTTVTTTTTSSSTTTSTVAGAGAFYRRYAASGADAPAVTIADRIRTATVDLGTVGDLLVPVAYGGSAVVDADAYETCYAHPGASFAGTADVVNLHGPQHLAVGAPALPCAAESATLVPLDDFSCYAASGPSIDQPIFLSDRFTAESVTVSTPTLLCLPAGIDGSATVNPAGALVCYATTTAGTAPGTVSVDNRFGPGIVDAGPPTGVCLPSLVTTITPTP